MKKVLLMVILAVGAVALPFTLVSCESTESSTTAKKSAYTCANCGGNFDKAGKCPMGCTLEKRCQNCGNAMSKCTCGNMK